MIGVLKKIGYQNPLGIVMKPLGKKKTCTRVAGHQECTTCHPEQKNMIARARQEDKKVEFEMITCDECLRPATITHEPPRRSSTSNDWWCDKHEPAVPKGWGRVVIK